MRIKFSRRAAAELEYHFEVGVGRFGQLIGFQAVDKQSTERRVWDAVV